MFRITFAVALALPFVAAPLSAQYRGSINVGAPKVSTSVQFGQTNLAVSYTAIAFGEGKWQGILDNKDGHEGFNKFAASKPIGSVSTNATVKASGREIPAGSYDLFFTVFSQGETSLFLLNLRPKSGEGKPIVWGMRMKESNTNNDRFKISLDPGAEKMSCGITVAFGKQSMTVPLTVGAPAKKGEK